MKYLNPFYKNIQVLFEKTWKGIEYVYVSDDTLPLPHS